MSAAEVPGKPARTAPNAANSIVVSSETRKTATHAIQNVGHGDAAATWRWAWGVSTRSAVDVLIARLLAHRLEVHGRFGREATMHLARDLVGQHFARAVFERGERGLCDRVGR